MSPWVRAYVLAGVEISFQHPLGGFTTIHNASSRGSNTLLTFMGTNHTCDAQTHAGKTLTHRSFLKNVGRPCLPPQKKTLPCTRHLEDCSVRTTKNQKSGTSTSKYQDRATFQQDSTQKTNQTKNNTL